MIAVAGDCVAQRCDWPRNAGQLRALGVSHADATWEAVELTGGWTAILNSPVVGSYGWHQWRRAFMDAVKAAL